MAKLYYRWSKDFLEAGKKRLLGDTQRAASSEEVVATADAFHQWRLELPSIVTLALDSDCARHHPGCCNVEASHETR